MAENVGKPGMGEGYGDTREASRPPARRDPRADPDDDELPVSLPRIDVVTVDRGSRDGSSADTLTNAALTLRRELAKLHQQAAAVERTIEDQRRERSDALERIETANGRAQELEQKLAQSEAELDSVRRRHEAALEDLEALRSERDRLARGVDDAKTTVENLTRARAEVDTLREAHDEALRAAAKYEAELGEIRKREQAGAAQVSTREAELGALRERLERTAAELSQARDEVAQTKAETARVRLEVVSAAEASAKLKDDAERERATHREQVERLERALSEAKQTESKLSSLESTLAASRRESSEARSELARLERDLDAVRHARDVNADRATMAEKEVDLVRKEADRLKRELEATSTNLGRAEARATAEGRARAATEDSVRQLRDEVTSAFARWRSISPSVPPPPSGSAPPTRALPLSQASTRSDPRMAGSEPPATKRGSTTSFPPLMAEARPLSMPVRAPEPKAADAAPISVKEVEDGWSSSPPPDPNAKADLAIPKAPAVASVVGEEGGVRSAPPLPTPSRPPPVPPPRRLSSASIPPAVYPSVPPPAGLAPTSPPPPRSSVIPAPLGTGEPSTLTGLSQERDALFDRLNDGSRPDDAREAALTLRDHPEWLRGRPPVELLAALTCLDYDVEAPIFELARAWEREAMSRAVIAALRDEPDAKLREHGAWLLKHLGSPSSLAAIADLVTSDSEPPTVRRWLLEAIERFVSQRAIGWTEVGDLVTVLVRHQDASMRDGVIGIIAATDHIEEKRRLLLELLRTDDDEIVLSSAVHALTSALPIELDPLVAERLLGHPSARVQRSVVEFVERSKRAPRA